MEHSTQRLAEAITLPCGLKLRNRLMKAAMAEGMSVGGLPSNELINVYAEWAEGGWGAVITGKKLNNKAPA